MDIRIQAAGTSDRGRVRRTNEDAFGFDLDRGLFVVCDGVGGSQAGEIASSLAVDCILSRFPTYVEDANAGGSELHRAVQAANRAILIAAGREPIYHGMCTTVVAAHYDGVRVWIAHVGDSRAYLLRNQSLHRLTEDHSELSQLLRQGTKTSPKDTARLEGVLTQAVGASDFIVPAVTFVQVEIGDCFLLATDGVTKELSQSEILSLLLASSSPEQACNQLVAAANNSGGHDNATCLIVQID